MSCALYRHFDEAGSLLYVGISAKPLKRLKRHFEVSPWGSRICSLKIEWFGSRRAAWMAERTAIWDERPECNKQFNQYVIEVRESTVTNEQIDKLLHALDLRCAGFDPDHYGLPLHSGASDIEELRMIVRRWVRKNIPETV